MELLYLRDVFSLCMYFHRIVWCRVFLIINVIFVVFVVSMYVHLCIFVYMLFYGWIVGMLFVNLYFIWFYVVCD